MAESVTINRNKFLRVLSAASTGLSPKDHVEQSSSFVFKDGRVWTYDTEVAFCGPTDLPKSFRGAVKGSPLIRCLAQLDDGTVDVRVGEGEFLIRGKNRTRIGIRMDHEIHSPIWEQVERPGEWRRLPDDFLEAVRLVEQCAATNEDAFQFTCLHLHPKFIEASDNVQANRYKIRTGLSRPIMVKRDSIKHVIDLDSTEWNERDNWLHFRNGSHFVLSCRRHLGEQVGGEYPDVSAGYGFSGDKLVLPKKLVKITELAKTFTEEIKDNNRVYVRLRKGELRIKGMGVSGWVSKTFNSDYAGKALEFYISPEVLMEIVKKHNDCQVGEDKLKVDGGRWRYYTILLRPDEVTNNVPNAPDQRDGRRQDAPEGEED